MWLKLVSQRVGRACAALLSRALSLSHFAFEDDRWWAGPELFLRAFSFLCIDQPRK